MNNDDSEENALEIVKAPRPTTRKERMMTKAVTDVRELSMNDIVTFYMHDDTVRYYVRLTNPMERTGVAVFHLNKKGRPSYRFIPRYTIRADQAVCLVFRRELSGSIVELLFKGNVPL